jgi:hypothetical protein
LNKLEKVALQRRKKNETPLIVIVNSTHLIRDDEDGRDLLELMQQRAEQWAASNLVTMGKSGLSHFWYALTCINSLMHTIVFNSDDYWVYERLKRYATRMETIPVPDLPKQKAMAALAKYRY